MIIIIIKLLIFPKTEELPVIKLGVIYRNTIYNVKIGMFLIPYLNLILQIVFVNLKLLFFTFLPPTSSDFLSSISSLTIFVFFVASFSYYLGFDYSVCD